MPNLIYFPLEIIINVFNYTINNNRDIKLLIRFYWFYRQ
jgi:hypothetical protein